MVLSFYMHFFVPGFDLIDLEYISSIFGVASDKSKVAIAPFHATSCDVTRAFSVPRL